MSTPEILIALFVIVAFFILGRIIGKGAFPYVKRNRVMNSSEKAFYIILKNALEGKYIVLSKVRIEDFIKIESRFMSWIKIQSFRGKIKSRHVDFLICDYSTTKPLLAIELDGPTHLDPKRIIRDSFVDEVYREAGLSCVHLLVNSDFKKEAEKIKNQLNQIVNN